MSQKEGNEFIFHSAQAAEQFLPAHRQIAAESGDAVCTMAHLLAAAALANRNLTRAEFERLAGIAYSAGAMALATVTAGGEA